MIAVERVREGQGRGGASHGRGGHRMGGGVIAWEGGPSHPFPPPDPKPVWSGENDGGWGPGPKIPPLDLFPTFCNLLTFSSPLFTFGAFHSDPHHLNIRAHHLTTFAPLFSLPPVSPFPGITFPLIPPFPFPLSNFHYICSYNAMNYCKE